MEVSRCCWGSASAATAICAHGKGSYIGFGVGSGITGRPLDSGIVDDPIKNDKEAPSQIAKEGHWNWYQAVFATRLSEKSGQIIMGTSWAKRSPGAQS